MPHDSGRLNKIIALALALFFIVIIVPASLVMLTSQDMNAGARGPPVQLTANSYVAVVTHPISFGMDSTYWNLTGYMVPNGSLSNATYTLTVYVNDHSGHNISGAATINAKDDHRVYGNITMASHASMVNIANATFYVKLVTGGNPVAGYVGTVGIVNSNKVNNLIQVVILIMVPALAAIGLAVLFVPRLQKK